MDSNVFNTINTIIKKRQERMQDIVPVKEKWTEFKENVSFARRMCNEIKSSCVQAMRVNPQNEPLLSLQTSIQTQLPEMFTQMESLCKKSTESLKRLSDRCNRRTLNIAVAGIGRCGKSTALKSILGFDQKDNSIIPSGGGTAVTAGKSTIICVQSSEEEKTIVKFHTEASFLDKLVNPYCRVIFKGAQTCETIDEFEALDLNKVQQELDAITGFEEADDDVSVSLRKTFLLRLAEIQEAIPYLRNYLGESSRTVPLNSTSKYVSYQENNQEQICYAVDEVEIYVRFPNVDIPSLKLIDLPGLGTCSESERKCFLDGFNYSVDLALIIRRPDTLFQNFPATNDEEVFKILARTFGQKEWEDCAFLFQNDGGLNPEYSQKSMAEVDEWKEKGGRSLAVKRGDAMDSYFMQEDLLPQVLKYMSIKLPQFDQTFFVNTEKELSDWEKQYTALQEKIKDILRIARKKLNVSSGFNAIDERVTQFRDDLLEKLTILLEERFDEENAESYEVLNNEIARLTSEIKAFIQTKYNPENADMMKKVQAACRRAGTLSDFNNDNIHAMRIAITEQYSKLENSHETLLKEMRDSVFEIFRQISGRMFSEDGDLQQVYEKFNSVESDSCDEILGALQDLQTLTAPFYTILYPTLRREVFHAHQKNWIHIFEQRVGNVQNYYFNSADKTLDKLAANTLMEFQNLGFQWVGEIELELYKNLAIPAIISAALERFADRVCRNEIARKEIGSFIEANWGSVQNSSDAYFAEITNKIRNIMDRF